MNRIHTALSATLLACFGAPIATSATAATSTIPKVSPNLAMTCSGDGDIPIFNDDFALKRVIAASTKTKVMPTISQAELVIGTTPAEIQANFASNIETNMTAGSAERLVGNLSDKELAALAQEYQRSAGVSDTPLLRIFSKTLSDKALVRVAGAFDKEAVTAAVKKYSTSAVASSFAIQAATIGASPALLPVGGGGGGGGGAAPAPSLDMSIKEIYLDFRTAPVGSLTVRSALAETSMFAGKKLVPAAAAGWQVGKEISALIDEYDPSLNDAIGGTVAGMVDAAHAAITDVEQGKYQSGFDDLFGFPVTNSPDPYGDWDISSPMMEYYGSGGTCGG